MAYIVTPDLGLELADPATIQPFETANVNSNFLKLEASAVQSRDRLANTLQAYQYRWADESERNAQSGMRAGDFGYQVDTGIDYRYSGSAWVAEFETIASPITPNAGYTVESQIARRSGQVVQLTYQITKSTTWSSSDNIGMVNPSSIRPLNQASAAGYNNSNGSPITSYIAPNGSIFISAGSGTSGASRMVLSATYIAP